MTNENASIEHQKQITEALKSYRQNYLNLLKSDLKKYIHNLQGYAYVDSHLREKKRIDSEFNTIALSFEEHKIRTVREEIEILENLDNIMFDNLAYLFDRYSFSFKKEEPTYMLPWFIHQYMSEPIFDAILYNTKLDRRNINWSNYKRDLNNFHTQLKKGLKLTYSFFPEVTVHSENELLHAFLISMQRRYLDSEQDGILALIPCLFPNDRKRLPKGLAFRKNTLGL